MPQLWLRLNVLERCDDNRLVWMDRNRCLRNFIFCPQGFDVDADSGSSSLSVDHLRSKDGRQPGDCGQPDRGRSRAVFIVSEVAIFRLPKEMPEQPGGIRLVPPCRCVGAGGVGL